MKPNLEQFYAVRANHEAGALISVENFLELIERDEYCPNTMYYRSEFIVDTSLVLVQRHAKLVCAMLFSSGFYMDYTTTKKVVRGREGYRVRYKGVMMSEEELERELRLEEE